jgi:hypothetical protein
MEKTQVVFEWGFVLYLLQSSWHNRMCSAQLEPTTYTAFKTAQLPVLYLKHVSANPGYYQRDLVEVSEDSWMCETAVYTHIEFKLKERIVACSFVMDNYSSLSNKHTNQG